MTDLETALRRIIRDELERAERSRASETPAGRPPAEALAEPVASTTIPELMSETTLSAWIDISVRTLQDWRTETKGPPFVRIGRLARYRRDAVQEWIRSLA